MDNDLDRSVRLLEEALSPLSKKRSQSRKARVDVDLSLTLRNYELDPLYAGNEFSRYDDTMALLLQSNRTFTGSILQAQNAPWKVAIDSLNVEFFEIMQSHSGSQNVLEVVSDLARCCSDALKIIQGMKANVAVSKLEEEICLENERNTWRLIYILYQDRLLRDNMMDCEGTQVFLFSEKRCVENFFKKDCDVRECQLVIDWLERNALDRDDEVLMFSDNTVGWENTLHQLQSAETIAFKSSRPIVTSMDPDAPNYQNLRLHDLDVDDEERLAKKMFMEIRCGKLEEAQKLCRQSGHSWKAAIFEGWKLYHDPSKDSQNLPDSEKEDDMQEESADELNEIEGNASRDIWKIMAMRYCKQPALNKYDIASIGAFSGFRDAILPVCTSWEDHLWARMKTIVDVKVEQEIRNSCIRHEEYRSLPLDYWDQSEMIQDVFKALESSRDARIRDESETFHHCIQKCIILHDIPKLLNDLEMWMEGSADDMYRQRFVAHLMLFFDQIGEGDRSFTEKALEGYISRLMNLKETQLVAFYISKLSPSNQVHLYARYLENVVEEDERKLCLSIAEDAGLDVLAITKQVVENIRFIPFETDDGGGLQVKLSEGDKFKISALDWVLFYENQRAEALIQANDFISAFLVVGKLDAAHLAFEKIPADSIKKIISQGDIGDRLNQTIKEYLSYKAYLDAHEAFNEWFKHSKNKPQPPANLPDNAEFPEKVVHEHKVSQYKAELTRWKLSAEHLVKNAKAMLYNVLLFPEGWLVGAVEDQYLRSTCIPEITLLLYSVLSESGQQEECVQLADVIASEKHCLYKVFSKVMISDLLIKLCESSVSLLNSGKDPWGNDMSA